MKRTSSLWETEPMYVTDQDRFLNGACEVSVRAYLQALKATEGRCGAVHLTVSAG